MKTVRFKHLFGAGNRFVRLERRTCWMPLNDPDAHALPELPAGLIPADPLPFPAEPDAAEHGGKVVVFDEAAAALARRRLEAAALSDLAAELAAARQQYGWEALLGRMDFHLKKDDLFD